MTRKNTRRTIAAVAAIAALSFMGINELGDITEGVGATGGPSPASESANPHEGDASALYNGVSMDESQARTALDALSVSEPAPMKGYSRDDFPHWLGAEEWNWNSVPDADDCDARDAALYRDGEGVVPDPSTCTPQQGTWKDPYTDETFTDSGDVDIDHIVPLASAHRAGADEWTEEQRTTYSNAPLVTVASGASSNREKGDKGPEVWKPESQEAWCPYAIRWIEVKDEYDLDLTSTDERDALGEMLDTCEGSKTD